MRWLYTILFLTGFLFAPFAWFALVLPWGVFFEEYHFTLRDVFVSNTVAALALSGYCIWSGWAWLALWGRCSVKQECCLSVVSIINHAGWLVIFPILRMESFEEFAMSFWPVFSWLIVNLTIAMLVALKCVGGEWEPAEIS